MNNSGASSWDLNCISLNQSNHQKGPLIYMDKIYEIEDSFSKDSQIVVCNDDTLTQLKKLLKDNGKLILQT